jgi:hypothetical protein
VAAAAAGAAAVNATSRASKAIAQTAAVRLKPRHGVDATGRGLREYRTVQGTMVDLPTMLGSVPAHVKRAMISPRPHFLVPYRLRPSHNV